VTKKIFIIAGESSGDMHGANLIKALLKIDKDVKIKGFGGEKMAAAGMEVVRGLDKLSLVGFVEIVKHLKTIKENFDIAKKEIQSFQPQVLVLIDYPGFNLRMAKWAKSHNITVYWYIAPQVWAWGKKRLKKMKKYIDKLFVILPFEKEFFSKAGIDTVYTGHPLLEEVASFTMETDFLIKNNIPVHKKPVAFFPGSRISEVKRNISPVKEVIKNNPHLFFLVAAPSSLPAESFEELQGYENVKILYDKNYEILTVADAGIIKSGTSTLEAALFDLPQVVIYKVNFLSYLIIKYMVKIKFASLVNLILGKEAVKELLQKNCNPRDIGYHLNALFEKKTRNRIFHDYQLLKEKLHSEDFASGVVAKAIMDKLKN